MASASDTIPPKVTEALPTLLAQVGYRGSWTVQPLAGDASNRTYYRVEGGKKTWVVMKLVDSGFNSPAEEYTKGSPPPDVLPFIDVQRYLQERGVRVPALYGFDEARGVLLLEDLGDQLLFHVVPTAAPAEIERLYKEALHLLETAAVVPPGSKGNSVAFGRSFDRDLYNWEFHHFLEYGLEKRLRHPPTSTELQSMMPALEKLTEEFTTWEPVFCHRDYHSRNLHCVAKQKGAKATELAVIDFQDALLAPLFYDLASLLRDSYIQLDSKLQASLVEQYRLQMKKHGAVFTDSRDAFRRAFDLMGLHRNMKAAGRFCYIDVEKGKPAYLADVPRTLTYIEETLDRYEELHPLRDQMRPYFDPLREACTE